MFEENAHTKIHGILADFKVEKNKIAKYKGDDGLHLQKSMDRIH